MSALDYDDLSVITGPLTVGGEEGVYLLDREVVRVLPTPDGEDVEDGVVWVYGYTSDLRQFIDASSLTGLANIDWEAGL